MQIKTTKLATVFIVGALVYGAMEIVARGFTHITMGILGGTAMVIIHILNDQRRESINFAAQIAIITFFITSIEFLAGEILNRMLMMNIWDYSDVPLNIDGQVCLPFVLIWVILSFVGITLDDFIRWKIFKEEPNFQYLPQKDRIIQA